MSNDYALSRESVYIIAEIGINHNGSNEIAKKLIKESYLAGVHAIKFQYRNLDSSYSSEAKEIGDELLRTEIFKTYLAPDILVELAKYSQSLGVDCGISFFNVKDKDDFGDKISEFDFIKIPSAELTNASLIDSMLDTGKHVYISTGCHAENHLESALSRLPELGWTPLHCISNYPTTLQNSKLGYIRHMQNRWKRDIGYSSHDENWEVCVLALQLGATVIERHITLDKYDEGLDHSSSSTPDEFKKLCLIAKNLDIVLSGDGPRVPNQGELLNRQNLGRSYFAKRDIAAGEVLELDLLDYRSPNTGLDNNDVKSFLGREVSVAVKKGTGITRGLFETPQVLSDNVVGFAKDNNIALPVRLHDINELERLFPIGAFEFHLSHKEICSDIDLSVFNMSNRYSIHLPDYVSSTQLMDPFSLSDSQRAASLNVLERTVSFAERMQEECGREVPIVGSFSIVEGGLDDFYSRYSELLGSFRGRGISILPQWLPPIAWYFGGSVELNVMNTHRDAELLVKHGIPLCMDVCHLILCRNFFGYSAEELFQKVLPKIQHIHIADASGVDGEGIAFGEGDPENMSLIRKSLDFDCMKVIEVWQGHLDKGAGFRQALTTLAGLSDD